jgi:hypothetical protein
MRCWQEGQRGAYSNYRKDWDEVKVFTMYSVNKAKYDQHPSLQQELLDTGSLKITGGPSTCWEFRGNDHRWQDWNGLVQMRLREEYRPVELRNDDLLQECIERFQKYQGSYTTKPTLETLEDSLKRMEEEQSVETMSATERADEQDGQFKQVEADKDPSCSGPQT